MPRRSILSTIERASLLALPESQDLGKFESERRYATMVALVLEGMVTVTDELIDLHDRILVKLISTAKNKHQQQFQKQGKAINDKVRLYSKIGHALLKAKESGSDPYAAIEAIIPWDDFTQSVTEADQMVQPESFDHLHLVSEQFNMLRRYTPEFLYALTLHAAPTAQGVLDAIEVIGGMNADNTRKVPADAPTTFIKPRWKSLVITDSGIDRRFYEICALSELKNSLRSGDIWVQGSRQFRNFDEYLLSAERFGTLKETRALPVAVNSDCNQYLHDRLDLLEEQLATVNRLALANESVIIASGSSVLDGLLYHESDLRIEEHYTDTAGFTDHVFALMHLLGFRFAPRIRDLKDTKLYTPKKKPDYSALQTMTGGTLNIKHVRAHWDEILRLAASIKQGTVTPSLMLRKLGSYPRQPSCYGTPSIWNERHEDCRRHDAPIPSTATLWPGSTITRVPVRTGMSEDSFLT